MLIVFGYLEELIKHIVAVLTHRMLLFLNVNLNSISECIEEFLFFDKIIILSRFIIMMVNCSLEYAFYNFIFESFKCVFVLGINPIFFEKLLNCHYFWTLIRWQFQHFNYWCLPRLILFFKQ